MRCSEMQTVRSIVSGGEPSALIQNEVLVLNDEERRALLQKAGISSTIAIGAAEVLAIKASLVIPWNKLRLLRRWLKSSGISLAGGEEIKGAPLIYIPELVAKVVYLLEENERTRRLTWYEGFIPASEVWIKIGGDKGGGTFKMNFQIVNIATPNSVHNTCVFCCFAAGDSVTNLHAALDRFKDQVCPPGLHITLGIFTKVFNLLEAVCCNLDLELALHATDVDSSSFSKYSLELQNLPLLQAELEEAQQAQENFQQWQHMWSWLVVQ
eukprot:Em0012g730a